MTETIIVENLKCGGCASSVKNSLEKLDQVKGVEVDLATSEVSVAIEGSIDREVLIERLHKLGYPEVGKGSTTAKMKSYVSCAIGRMNN